MARAIEMERSRSDRTGGVFSLVLLDVAEDRQAELAHNLNKRLRITDVSGVFRDSRIAILLPDTPIVGAKKLVVDLMEAFSPNRPWPECEILVHPGDELGNDWPSREQNGDSASRRKVVNVSRTASERSVLGDDRRSHESVSHISPLEATIAKQMPLWKRSMDIVGAVTGLILSMPVILIAAIAIKLTSRGPVFYSQMRDGHAGRPFPILKLRTMVVTADKQKKALLALNEQEGAAFKITSDPRVTAIGRILRATSLDELPQFWNVLNGSMSLVGPRPLPCDEAILCERWQRVRLQSVPGLTCTWQVSGRSHIVFRDWVRMDIRYIQDMSPWNDIKLLLRTIPAILSRKGAH
jgi:lipopolysaccharide/colanic/teichoic acid biosynthesis glycosyltransferase